MIFFVVIALSIIIWFNRSLALRGILIFSLAIPKSFETTAIFSINILGFNVLYSDLLVGIAIIAWILMPNAKYLRVKEIKKIKIAIYLLVYLAIIGILRGLLLSDNVSQILFDSRPIFYYVIIIVSMDVFGNEKDLIKISKSILIGLSLYCVFILSYFILKSAHPFYDLLTTVMAGFSSRIAFHNDIYLLFGFPILIYLIKRSSLSNKLPYLFLLILFTFQLMITMSRTLLFLSILSILLSLYKLNGRSFNSNFSPRIFIKVAMQSVIIIVPVVFCFYLFFPNLIGDGFSIFLDYTTSRYTGIFQEQYSGHVQPRINLIETGINQITAAPIFGHGFGHFFTVKGWHQALSFIDNSYVTLWIRMGLVGILPFSLIFFYYYKILAKYRKYQRMNSNLHLQALNSSIPIGLILILVNCLNVSFLVNSTAILPLCIILGSTIGFWNREIMKSNS